MWSPHLPRKYHHQAKLLHYYIIIDYIPCAVHYNSVAFYFIIGSLYLSVPFTFFTLLPTLTISKEITYMEKL